MVVHDDASLSSRGAQQANVAIAFLVLAWIFIVLRVWTRTYVIKSFGWDDSTMILAGIVFSIYCATMLYIEANGGGTHIKDVPQLINLTKWTIVGEATYIGTVMILKISLGIFFARIVVKRWHLWIIWTTVATSVASSVASFFYCLLRCGPNLDLYVYRQLASECTPRKFDLFIAYQQVSITTLTDIVFVSFPFLILRKANMDTRSKVSVGLILSLAALGCICSMVRFRYVDGLTEYNDFFWNATNIAIWSTVEPGAGIVAGCLATLRPLLKRFAATARSIRSSETRSAKHRSKSGRSMNTSSNVKSTPESRERSSTDGNAAEELTNTHQDIELRSGMSKKAESKDCILEQTYDDRPWLAQRSDSPDLDTQSSRTYFSRQSSWTNRSKATSDACILDRPLPPLPLDLRHWESESV
ncbi:hypothetical protein K491DRAFT_589929 [Lophiostoma macrostomum CBS 122681]|uniref:Rhodopsin domain-containing protein n=1 Tax=Lophiostoma macrostomum CBS 122681 TaxID=1314788 RepID=A0A6A6TN83_9PLEO|nr:hypothetical protein K491DRAFT_589929 [Lophiostoma macrostomum CBS 122681]